MSGTIVVLLLLIGMVPGYFLGRTRAELGWFFHEIGRARSRRNEYRK